MKGACHGLFEKVPAVYHSQKRTEICPFAFKERSVYCESYSAATLQMAVLSSVLIAGTYGDSEIGCRLADINLGWGVTRWSVIK
jgi:hypothetical protein